MYSKEDIIALEPIYVEEKGDIVIIHGLDGSLTKDNKRISTIFKQMSKYDLIDMEQVRLLIKRFLNIRKNIPYVFNKDNIFIGIKTRVPIGKNDGAFSYIKISSIDKIEEKRIYLETGNIIKILENKNAVERKINNGMLASLAIEERELFLHRRII